VRRAVVIGDGDKVMLHDLMGIEDTPRPVAAVIPTAQAAARAGSAVRTRGLAGGAWNGHGENVTLTAQELGVSRVTLYVCCDVTRCRWIAD